MSTLRKIDRMHSLFGRCEGHTCGECNNFVTIQYRSVILKKCRIYGITHSEASDWAKNYTACKMFNRQYAGTPIIRMAQHHRANTPEEQIEGQMEL